MTCFHCGEPLREPPKTYQVKMKNRLVDLCCTGCEAIAQSIVDNGLLAYYEHRTTAAKRQDLIPDELALSWYDHQEIEKEFVRTTEHEKEVTLAIDNIVCAACAWLMESHLFKQKGVRYFRVNATNHRAILRWDPAQTQLSDILLSLHQLGYPAAPFEWDKYEQQHQKQIKHALYRLGVAGIATMQVMMIAIALYFEWFGDLEETFKQYLRWVSALFAAPVLLYSAFPFYQSAWRSLKSRALNMDVPVSLALILAFSASVLATVTGQGEVFFESITMFTFLLLLGRFGELKARHKASLFSANLYKATPSIATLQSGQLVATKSLKLDDVIVVRAGDVIPIDGKVQQGSSACDEAMLTGESQGIIKNVGDCVFAGSINLKNTLTISVTATNQNTWLSQILKWQDDAQKTKPKVLNLTDKVSHYFVLVILLLSVATFAYWWRVDHEQALWITVAVLVATCPCALSLATPTAFTCATAKLSRMGILIKQAHVWDTLAKVTRCVLDKTGTLTKGKMHIQEVLCFSDVDETQARAIAASLEQHVNHPIAQAFKHETLLPMENISQHAAQGVSGGWQNQQWQLGHFDFVGLSAETFPDTSGIWLTRNGNAVAQFILADAYREHTEDFIASAKSQAWSLTVLTGDPSDAEKRTLQNMGIKQVENGLFPDQKLQHLNRLAEKDVVMMIGDGMNDAPVLAGAHVSIAMNQGADLAKSSADAILLGETLLPIVNAATLAKKCQRIVKQNFAWALGYNLLILPLAMMGLVPPYIAVLGMSFSSLLVITNSLRLLK